MMAVVFAAVTMYSAGAMTMSTTASAAGTAVIEEKGEKGDTAGAAFDAVADLFPGGRMALEPFRNMQQREAGENDLIRTEEKKSARNND